MVIGDRKIRVILVDDHHTIHLEIGALLRTFEDVELVAQGGNGKEAVLLCDQHQPDIVLMDISMPVMNGIEATRLILERHPQIRVIAMTGLDDAGTVQRMIAAGAAGYLLKEAPPAELASIIHAVYGGNAVFSADVMKPLLAPRHQRQTRCAMITA
ncbi:MAG: response regulator transcription factor [Chloroflexi bacterium]|nr:response regulator transcription factor [Chloroflexota bacterium]